MLFLRTPIKRSYINTYNWLADGLAMGDLIVSTFEKKQ